MLKVCPMPSGSPSFFDHSSTPSPPPMDTLELAPGVGIGPFTLGDSLWAVLDMLRARKVEVPKVEVSWDPDNAPKSAVTVHAGPVTLLFPSPEQRLSHILIGGLDNSPLTLTYEGMVLSSRSHPLTRAGVARALGPTYAADGAARLTYPGVAFKFAASGPGGNKDAVVAVDVTPREEETSSSHVTLLPGVGAALDTPTGKLQITLNETSAQDLLLDLGPPLRKYWKVKEDDRMDRMWGKSVSSDSPSTGCFWNYFQLGLDFLVVDGIVTKIVAHSNIPGTPEFQQYARCPWVVHTDSGVLDATSPIGLFRAQLSEGGGTREQRQAVDGPQAVEETPRPSSSGGKKKKKGGNGNNNAAGNGNGDSNGHGNGDKLPSEEAPPDAMVLERSVEGGLDGIVGMSRSQLIGFKGLVVEVDESNGAITSVQVAGD